MRAVAAALAVGFAALAVVAPAAAAPGKPEFGAVILEAAGCAPRVAADTRRIVGIELGVLLLPPTAPPEQRAAADRLGVACEAGAAALVATGGPGRATVRRRLLLADLPDDAASRVVALAGIEMLAALSPAVRAQVEGRAPESPAATVIATPSSERSAAPAPRVQGAILGAVRTFSSGAGVLPWGASGDYERSLGGLWGFAGNVEIVAGGTSSALGNASEQLASLAGCWEAAARGAHWAGAVGLGGRVGLARFAGTAPSGSGVVSGDVLRPWAGPALSLRARLGGSSFAVAFLGEVGFALRGAQGLSGGDVLLAASGRWLSAALGVGF